METGNLKSQHEPDIRPVMKQVNTQRQAALCCKTEVGNTSSVAAKCCYHPELKQQTPSTGI